jgi:hypothetical protein
MRSFRSALHSADKLFQSCAVGVRSPGSALRALRIEASGIPVRCATMMMATRRSTSREYRRWVPLFHKLLITPFDS